MITGREEFHDDYNRTVAGYYDVSYATLRSLGPDRDFYTQLARTTGGPVLELGCGTGRVLLEIARSGIEAVGVDSSEAMLDVLRTKPGAERIELHRSLMQDLDLADRRFSLIFSAFRAFQHLYSTDDQLACLSAVRRHLTPNGIFAFDVLRPSPRIALEREPETEDLHFEDGSDSVVRYVTVERDSATQMTRLDVRFERRREGKVISNEHERIFMRWFYRYELEHLMHRAGFAEVEIYGDFDRSSVGPNSPAFVVVAS